jgi:prophage regulatory protein
MSLEFPERADPGSAIQSDEQFLPVPARLIRLPEVMARVGLKRSAIYQRMSEGRFPKSRSLGPKCTVWVETDIDAWIDSIAKGYS